jgi:hypothetical protein
MHDTRRVGYRRDMSPSPRAALLAVLALLVPAAVASAGSGGFQTPSHNIACSMFDSHSSGAFVRCDIADRDWSLPHKPSSQGCKELDFEGDVMVTASGRGHFICAGDTQLRQGPVLHYGHHKTVGRFTCSVSTKGVTCRNGRTHHGFFYSKESYRFF